VVENTPGISRYSTHYFGLNFSLEGWLGGPDLVNRLATPCPICSQLFDLQFYHDMYLPLHSCLEYVNIPPFTFTMLSNVTMFKINIFRLLFENLEI
jgi:hypothetical protein